MSPKSFFAKYLYAPYVYLVKLQSTFRCETCSIHSWLLWPTCRAEYLQTPAGQEVKPALMKVFLRLCPPNLTLLNIYTLHTFIWSSYKALSGTKSALYIPDYYDLPAWQNIRGHLLDNQPPFSLDSLEHLGNGAEDRLAIYEGRQDHSTGGESCYCENDTLPRR